MARALWTAVVVGTTLTAVNQWPQLQGRDFSLALLGRVAVNFLVPFAVSLVSARSTRRALERVRASDGP